MTIHLDEVYSNRQTMKSTAFQRDFLASCGVCVCSFTLRGIHSREESEFESGNKQRSEHTRRLGSALSCMDQTECTFGVHQSWGFASLCAVLCCPCGNSFPHWSLVCPPNVVCAIRNRRHLGQPRRCRHSADHRIHHQESSAAEQVHQAGPQGYASCIYCPLCSVC
jgi:hypothetical protein